MKDGEHYHNQGDPEGKHTHRKLAGIILLAVISAFIAYGVAQTAQTTADNNANITNVFEVVVNNTDIGCYGGEGGTCERVSGTTYDASNYSRNVYLKYHVVNNNAHTIFYVYINGTVVLWRDFTTIQADQNESFAFNIPKGANFSYYNNSVVHHVEWREYPVLSGRNGTLSINQTFVTTGSSFNSTYDSYNSSINNATILYNIQSFGATSNDETDDTIPIQNTLNAAASASKAGFQHSVVYVPCGIFIANGLVMPSYSNDGAGDVVAVELRGQSKYCSIIENRHISNPILTIDNNKEAWDINNIFFAGNRSYAGGKGINLTYAMLGKIHDNKFYLYGNSISTEKVQVVGIENNDFNDGADTRIMNKTAGNPTTRLSIDGIAQYGIFINLTDNSNYLTASSIKNNRFMGVSSCIYTQQSGSGYATGIIIENNVCQGTNGTTEGAITVKNFKNSYISTNWEESLEPQTALSTIDGFRNTYINPNGNGDINWNISKENYSTFLGGYMGNLLMDSSSVYNNFVNVNISSYPNYSSDLYNTFYNSNIASVQRLDIPVANVFNLKGPGNIRLKFSPSPNSEAFIDVSDGLGSITIRDSFLSNIFQFNTTTGNMSIGGSITNAGFTLRAPDGTYYCYTAAIGGALTPSTGKCRGIN